MACQQFCPALRARGNSAAEDHIDDSAGGSRLIRRPTAAAGMGQPSAVRTDSRRSQVEIENDFSVPALLPELCTVSGACRFSNPLWKAPNVFDHTACSGRQREVLCIVLLS